MTQPTEAQHLEVERRILDQALRDAQVVRDALAGGHTTVVNLMSAPGSGKTELLGVIGDELRAQGQSVAVLVGDCATEHDADRLRSHVDWVHQIVTDGVCHLEARMLFPFLAEIGQLAPRYLFVENVGNMVCPVDFDLGEAVRIALLSVTEGEDKPVKYPGLFGAVDLVVVSKIDLASAVDFSLETVLGYLQRVNPGVPVISSSAKTGVGLDAVIGAIRSLAAQGSSLTGQGSSLTGQRSSMASNLPLAGGVRAASVGG
ncbi:hydrogenase nickel incorporation protein HypB [Ferrimicrobium sp.]|uniref:hydrogenase nickel incorporation protein HypB n=1 Tax=Ferrimicrobium sp. TaxID=2926050 RepID=UPI00260AAF01|nr:hydrogenase nickel incorporation protein HypB [Ferrimicrobium sp.]